ncbi:MAG TPA: hypothetical protein VFL94_06430 [Actinomycetales bacterium]|nr:hypothetical protein [Actinomycetales bacterium]
MTDPGQARSRVLRATALAAVAVTLALGAHRLSGGAPPTASTLLQSLLVLAVVMGLLTAGRRRPTTLLVGLGGSQLLLHEWFALATPGECAGHLASQVPGVHLLPQQLLPWGLLADTARACATTGDTGATLVAVAVVTHALAALATGVLLSRGEALLVSAVAFVLPALPTARPVLVRRMPPSRHQVMVLPGTVRRRQVRRRGPPATVCAA